MLDFTLDFMKYGFLTIYSMLCIYILFSTSHAIACKAYNTYKYTVVCM